MTIDARFHELKGIGPATEAKLHESGVHTWVGLAMALDAIARIKDVDAKRLREIRDLARERADDAAADTTVDGERSARYIVRVVAHPDGRAARSTVVDVRSGREKAFSGIPGDQIVGFIHERLSEMAPAQPLPAESLAAAESRGWAELEELIRFSASSTEGDIVVVDAGKAIGGSSTSITRRWDTSGIDAGETGSFQYRASLAGRPYGTDDASGWRRIGMLSGVARPGELVELQYPADDLAPGINRLDLTIEIEAPLPGNPGARRVESMAQAR